MKAKEFKALSNPLSHCAIRIGVDPGVTTGIAIYSPDCALWILKSLSFWEAYDVFTGYCPTSTGFVIETPNAKRVLYAQKDGESSGRGRERMAANVGSNRREAVLLAERLESLGYTVVRKTPVTHKWSAKDLKRHTGLVIRTNEHVRDAIKLVVDYI